MAIVKSYNNFSWNLPKTIFSAFFLDLREKLTQIIDSWNNFDDYIKGDFLEILII